MPTRPSSSPTTMAKATKEKVVKSPKGKVEKKEAKPKKAAPTKEKKVKKVRPACYLSCAPAAL